NWTPAFQIGGSLLTNVTASAGSGNVYINSTAPINLQDSLVDASVNIAGTDFYLRDTASAATAVSMGGGTSPVQASNLLLLASNGSIGTGAASAILTNAPNMTANAASGASNVFINSSTGVTLVDTTIGVGSVGNQAGSTGT